MSFIDVGGLNLRISDRGRGEVIVLVHGWKMSHRVFDRATSALSDGHRVIAFDLRGMGESDKPNSRYDFEELAGDLGQVLRLLDVSDVTLIGWSMGCSVVLHYMATGGPRVGRIGLCNGPLRLTTTRDFPYAMDPATVAKHLKDVAESWPTRERRFTAEALRDPQPELVDWIMRIALQTPLDIVLRLVRAQARLDHRSVLAGLQVPVLALYGRYDPYYPPGLAHFIAQQAAEGRAVIFERSAHFPFIEEADRFASTVSEYVGAKGFSATSVCEQTP